MILLSSDFIDKRIHAERCALALGWLQPIDLNDTGYQLQLSGKHFSMPQHSFVYAYVCLSAQAGRTPDVHECMLLARQNHVDLKGDFLFNLILSTDICDGMLPTYCESVLEYAHKHERAQQCFDEYKHIVNDDDNGSIGRQSVRYTHNVRILHRKKSFSQRIIVHV